MIATFFKRLLLSVIFIGGAALVLLLSDLHSRNRTKNKPDSTIATPTGRTYRIALLKHSSNQLLDDIEKGCLEQMAAAGYPDGQRFTLDRFNAEGDLPTANAIASRMTDGSFDMAISISTLSLQCVANANKDGRTIHVFAGVTDPSGAGVGIERMNSTNKPRWLAGMGTFQPVEKLFREAKRIHPGLKVVGVIWNPAERNSEVCTAKAREVCKELGIQLIEANVDQSKDVREAAESLVVRGAEAFWTGVDATVNNASAAICQTAAKAKIPVICNSSGQVREGTLFDLGADYTEVGHALGAMANSIIAGRDPATVVITNFMPERVMLNKQVCKTLRQPWVFPPELQARACFIIGEDGRVEKEVAQEMPRVTPSLANKHFKIGFAYFGPDEGMELAIKGLVGELKDRYGLEAGRNLEIQRTHANGEISGIPTMLQALGAQKLDAIVAFSTPVITASCASPPPMPVVFTYCTDPIAAGAGQSFEHHLPHVTGIGSFPPLEDVVKSLGGIFPHCKLGLLYNNAEANSVKVVSILRELCASNKIEVVEAIANNTSEVVPSIQSLIARDVSVVYIPGDNTAYQAFEGMVGRLHEHKIPLIADSPEFMERGAAGVIGVGYGLCGVAAAEPLARVLSGEKPGSIPMRNVTEKKILFNLKKFKEYGITIPPAIQAMQTPAGNEASKTAPATNTPSATSKPVGKKWRLQALSYIENAMVEDAEKGFEAGLKAEGFQVGRDYEIKTRCASGDMATLPILFDSARTDGADLYVIYGTATLQTAIQKNTNTPMVFTVVADPFLVGAGKSDTNHMPCLTGVYTIGPYREMAELLRDHFPKIKHIGTVFCPSEVNSVANKDILAREAARCGLQLEAVPANSPSELPDAATALCGRSLDAVVQVIDNMSTAGFSAISRAASSAHVPVFACQGNAVKQGASLALARDYFDAGQDVAKMAARIMQGQSPASIPLSPPSKVKKLVNLKNAQACDLQIPADLLPQMKQLTEP
jgi:ABC-type uncharacterized transport system substrate-binding protein